MNEAATRKSASELGGAGEVGGVGDEIGRLLVRRIVPVLFLCYCASYLDRVNLGFAALTMNRDLHLSATQFGLASGLFFLGYFTCEIPSNLILARVGARRWIARIMLSWSLVAALMAFVHGAWSLYGVRLLLGVAEAGFFPGLLFYLTLWFPRALRARVLGLILLAVPLSSTLGAPLSTAILGLGGLWGLAGWQWLFLIETLPSLLMGVLVLRLLPDRPEDAPWLSAAQKQRLGAALASEEAAATGGRAHAFRLGLLLEPRLLAVTMINFAMAGALYGLAFWLPQIVHGFRLGLMATGLVSALPFLVGAVAMLAITRSSDRRMERHLHLMLGLAAMMTGLLATAFLHQPVARMAAICLASAGIYAAFALLWTLPPTFLAGTAAAGGIAAINAFANLAGFLGPFTMGLVRDLTGRFDAGLYLLAALAGCALLCTALLRRWGSSGRTRSRL